MRLRPVLIRASQPVHPALPHRRSSLLSIARWTGIIKAQHCSRALRHLVRFQHVKNWWFLIWESIRLERRDTTTIATRCLVSRSDPCSCSQQWFGGLGPRLDNARIVSAAQLLQKTRCHFDTSAGVIFAFEELVEAIQNGHINSWLFLSVLLTRLLEANCMQTCIPMVPFH